jgi:hypothetical protein
VKLRALLVPAVGFAFVACGGSVVEDDGQGGGGGGLSCELDQPGETFAFTIRNVGDRYLRLAYGCGRTRPIVVDVDGQVRGISPGQADGCEVSCDEVYAGYENWGCSDCGPGSGVALAPGDEDTITWDRRVYAEHTAPTRCSGHVDGNLCALGTLVPAELSSRGTLTYCVNDELNPEYADGYCGGDEAQVVGFDVDLAQSSVVIEIE